jgi:mannose/fructose-specific phosphotransferase system component IIA
MARVPALLVMHSDLAGALLRAASSVYGAVDDVEVMSNEGLSRETLEERIEERVSGWTQGGLILTDFWGGSCHLCGISATRGHGDIAVITGLNLPTLLDYLHNREQYSPLELAERLLKKGRDSIRIHQAETA